MYLALYRKWRPKTFDDVISQEHITTTLINQVRGKKTAHAYLFTGSRGTGKTTCAKILAKAVNCPNAKNGEPCLTCDICLGIDDASVMDVVEIDAASNNGVDNIRDLRDEANYTPALCKYRVYIVDEVHMLSTGAFNALLKIMEEPPSHVMFILATTEIHKVPVTIVSRCQRFDFRRIRTEDIAKRLRSIAAREDFTLDEDASFFIAKLADGGMRDALSVLDQCTAFSNHVDTNTVATATGVSDKEHLFKIVDALIAENPTVVLQTVDELYNLSKDFDRLCEELIFIFRNMMLLKSTKNGKNLIIASLEEIESLEQYADKMDLAGILHCISALQDAMVRLGYTTNKRLEMEMCLLKLCSPKLDTSADSLNRRLSKLEKMIKNGVRATAPKQETRTVSASAGVFQKIETKAAAENQEAFLEKPKIHSSKEEDKILPVNVWPDIIADLKDIDKPLAGILSDSAAYANTDTIYIESANPFFGQLIRQDGNVSRLKQAIVQQMGKNYRIRLKGSQNINNTEQGNALEELAQKAVENGIDVQLK